MLGLLFFNVLILMICINSQTSTNTPQTSNIGPTIPYSTANQSPNPINNMDQRVRALERHFYPEPNAISYLEDYYNDDGESILTLDTSLRQLLGTQGNDFRAAEDDYRSNIPAPKTRNGYNILEMDEEIYKLQQRLTVLEDEVDALETNDYDQTLLLLIKQMQCELSQLATPGLVQDCRVAGCQYQPGQILTMLNDISPNNEQCPVGFDERTVNSAGSAAHSLINNNKQINDFGNDGNDGNDINDYNYLQSQMYYLYTIIGFLFGLNMVGVCCVFYTKKMNQYGTVKFDEDQSNQL